MIVGSIILQIFIVHLRKETDAHPLNTEWNFQG